jgi:hypothetical protein
MADTKISAMTAATSLTGAELIPIVQGGANKSITASLFAAPTQKNTQTASYVLALTDATNTLVEMNVGSANNVTVPTNVSVAFPIGTQIPIAQYGAGLTSIVASGGVTVNTSSGSLSSPGQYSMMVLEKRAADEWYLFNGTAGFSNPMTNVGDMIMGTTSGAAVRLADVATGNALISGGVNTQPSWNKITSSHVDATIALANNVWVATGSTTITGNTTQTGAFTNTTTLNGELITQNALSSGWIPALKITQGAHTAMTTTVEFPAFTLESQTVTHAAGTIATQRDVWFKAQTHSTATITNSYTLYADAPASGTNKYGIGTGGNANIIGTLKTNNGATGIDGTGIFVDNIRVALNGLSLTGLANNTTVPVFSFAPNGSMQQTTGNCFIMQQTVNTNITSGSANISAFNAHGIIAGTGNSGNYIDLLLDNTVSNWGGDVYGIKYDLTTPANIVGHNYFLYATSGEVVFPKTITAIGTTGNQTINKMTGTLNIAGTGTTVTLTNSLISSTSIVMCWLQTNDATAKSVVAVPGTGSCVFTLNAASTGTVAVGFFVTN